MPTDPPLTHDKVPISVGDELYCWSMCVYRNTRVRVLEFGVSFTSYSEKEWSGMVLVARVDNGVKSNAAPEELSSVPFAD